jgi:hypothetical protein
MGVKAAVICEDHTNDQYIVRPLIAELLKHLGKPQANVRVVSSPRLHGFEDVVGQACALLERWGAASDIVIFAVDTDCDDGELHERNKILALGNALNQCTKHLENAVVVFARQEVEVWALWGVRGDLGTSWDEVRKECHPKETFFEPQVRQSERKRPDGGRTRLMQESLRSGWQSIRSRSPELAQLEEDVKAVLS